MIYVSNTNPYKVGVFCRTLVLFLVFLSFGLEGNAQIAGDYSSVATGNWTALTTWQRYNIIAREPPNTAKGYSAQLAENTGSIFDNSILINSNDFSDLPDRLGELGKTTLNTSENWISLEDVDLSSLAGEFEQRQFTIARDIVPLISNINLNPELNVSYFGNYQIQAEVIVPEGATINSVNALVTPLNGEEGNDYINYYTNGTPIGDETKTFTLNYDWVSGKYLYSFLRPDDIYPEIAFLSSSVTHSESPSDILVHRNQYQMMHFQNPFVLGDNTSFFIEFYTVPVSLSGPPSVDMQVYLVKKQKTTAFFQSAWINSPDVELVGTINRYDDFSHSHSAYSRHHVIRLSTNSDGTIGNKQLDISDDFWIVLYAPTQLVTRAWNLKYHPTYNNNSTWYVGSETGYTVTAQTGCPDVHIHVARNNDPVIDGVNVEVTVNYNNNLETSNNENFSFGQLQNLPPNASTFILPEPGVYSGKVNIEWYPATDPNNDLLTYNLYLIDLSGIPDTISVETGLTKTSYELNTTLYANADYDILVEACDAEFCTGFNWSSNIDVGEYFRILNDAIWTGNTSNNWFTASNWSTNAVPNSSENIVIPSTTTTFPVISGASSGSDFALTATGTLSVEDGATLTLAAGPVLIIESGAMVSTIGSGKIILEPDAVYLNLSNSAPVLEVRRTLTGAKGWRMVASPVATNYADMFASPLVNQGFDGSSFPALQPSLLWWDETDGGTSLQSWRKPGSITDKIAAGRGHFHYLFNGAGRLNLDGTSSGVNYPDVLPQTMSVTGAEPNIYEGIFNFAPVTFTPRSLANQQSETRYNENNLLDEGWNLIGNPSASTLDWDVTSAWTKTNIDNTIYVWDPSAQSGNGEYLTWNGTTGTLGNGKISPFQAFWVHANTTSPVLSFTNAAKSATAGTFLKSATDRRSVNLQLSLTGLAMETNAFVTLDQEGVTGADSRDAYRLEPMGDTWLALYTGSSLSHNAPLVINNLPIDRDYAYIPLYVDAQVEGTKKGGQFVLYWEVPDNWPAHLNLTLMDHRLNKAIPMLQQSSYMFEQSALKSTQIAAINPLELPRKMVKPIGTEDELKRASLHLFAIVIGGQGGLDIPTYQDSTAMLLAGYPNPYWHEITLQFSIPDDAPVRIDVFDMQGRLIDTPISRDMKAGVYEIKWAPAAPYSGICVFRLVSGKSVITFKGVRLER
jgi:hypothetical protein